MRMESVWQVVDGTLTEWPPPRGGSVKRRAFSPRSGARGRSCPRRGAASSHPLTHGPRFGCDARKSPGSAIARQAAEKAMLSGAGIRLESGWKVACHFLGFWKDFGPSQLPGPSASDALLGEVFIPVLPGRAILLGDVRPEERARFLRPRARLLGPASGTGHEDARPRADLEVLDVPSRNLTDAQFLAGDATAGEPVTLSGRLRMPDEGHRMRW